MTKKERMSLNGKTKCGSKKDRTEEGRRGERKGVNEDVEVYTIILTIYSIFLVTWIKIIV